MNIQMKIAGCFAAATLGACAYSYWRGLRGRALVVNAASHGVILGSGLALAAWLASQHTVDNPVAVPVGQGFFSGALALANSVSDFGKMGLEARDLISKIDAEKLYAPFKKSGVTLGRVPDNEYTINQDVK